MGVTVKSLSEFVKELPPDIQIEVRDFAEFLLQKRKQKPRKPLLQGWAGALSKYRCQYTAVKLQHKALEWRCSEESSSSFS